MKTEDSEGAATKPAFIQTDEAARAAYDLDGSTPDFVAAPDTQDACVELIRCATGERCALVPWGGGTAIAQGNRLRAAQWAAVSTARLAEIEEFSPDDMVVTAQAGLTLAALQRALAERRQWIPIDAPQAERATLGGIVATNAQGLYRPAFGAPRDRLLGVRVALSDGSVIRGGGKVVKNVAGYDLCKLFAGSWGTLGLITEVTFKTNPLPEARSHLLFAAASLRAAAEAALQVHAARIQPAYLTTVFLKDEGNGIHPSSFILHPLLCVGLLGGAQTIAWQEAEISETLEAAGLKRASEGLTEDELRHLTAKSSHYVAARFTVRPSDIPMLVEGIQRCADKINSLTLAAHVPTGVIEVTFDADREVFLRELSGRMARLVPAGGHLVWTRVPGAWKTEVDVWGPTRGDFALMRGIKAALDPEGLFSSGRFVGRL